MTDMTAFERQLSSEISGLMGPVRPVDDLAVFESVTAASRQKGWGFTTLSALKLVAASVIVALFGGFLLAGVLTTPDGEVPPAAVTESPSPMTAEELLSGMVTEEVEPGVLRVINDGVRDLMPASRIVVGDDGSVWGVRDEGIFRLGGESIEFPTERDWPIFVAPDGALWVGLHTYDGEGWTEQPAPASEFEYSDVYNLDGTIWAAWPDPLQPQQWTVGRLDGDEWRPLDTPLDRRGPREDDTWTVEFLTSDGEDLWAWREPYYPALTGGSGTSVMSRWAEGEWQEAFRTGMRRAGEPTSVDLLALGPDGTSWLLQWESVLDDSGEPYGIYESLRSFDGSEWRQWGVDDLKVKVPNEAGADVDAIGVSPDGSLWVSLDDTWPEIVGEDIPPICYGVARFDGERWDRYLVDLCAKAIMGPDGSVWALASGDGEDWGDDDNWGDLYVITPETVAATE